MKILLLGGNGQIGWELQRSLVPLGQVKACNHHTSDLENLDGMRKIVHDYCPDVIINAAAYTAVDKAESEPAKAYLVNAKAVELLAEEAKQLDALLIHYSTDYVFDGTKTCAYIETDIPNPQSIYGKTKLQGEQAIEVSGCMYLIFRTSWVYAARGNNFVTTIIRLAKEQDELKVVSDQIGAPTSAELIADVTSLCLYIIIQDKAPAKNRAGIFHLTPTGKTSWHGFAQYVITEAQKLGDTFIKNPTNIISITTPEYPLPAKRPANSMLNSQKLCETFGIYLPSWQVHACRVLKELYLQEA